MASNLKAQTVTTLVMFDGANGTYPIGPLIQFSDGDFYGTTQNTFFKIAPGGVLTTLDVLGGAPNGGLALSGGKFYGTTLEGGVYGFGSVFAATPAGVVTSVHDFQVTEGIFPYAPVVLGSDGNFYGTTGQGGSGNHGTVYKVTPAGTLTILHNFTGTEGDYPGALVQGVDGNFYGTTENGGADNDGTVYKITPSGALTTLHVFDGVDGKGPGSGLLLARDGNFYGTTIFGGASSLGTVFRINQTGSFTSLHSFLGSPTEGYEPGGALIQATDGYFYGLTQLGGAQSGGTIYKMAADGTITTLFGFNFTDGFAPAGALVQGTSGIFYGVTIYGGTNDEGTLFSADLGLGPFVELRPRSGKVGATVQILGTNLQGATGVAFNGVNAAFVVSSPSLILARVPAGATSGRVVVRTSAGAVVSNLPFKVK